MQKTVAHLSIRLCILFLCTLACTILYVFVFNVHQNHAIRVGLLYSQTGAMAPNEVPVLKATLLAIEEINKNGGVLGKKIDPIVVDGASDSATFSARAETLITQNHVAVLFGCLNSECRKVVKEVVEKYDNLLFYPASYEGIEASPNIVYTGAVPNQQIIPAITWCFYNVGKTFYLVGSDYVFSHVVNEIIKNYADRIGAKVVGESYQSFNNTSFTKIVQEIKKTNPHVIINTLVSASKKDFFEEVKKGAFGNQKFANVSLAISEHEFNAFGTHDAQLYLARSYYHNYESKENTQFLELFKNKYGTTIMISDAMEAAFFGVHLWVNAVQKAHTTTPSIIKKKIKGEGLLAPEGVVYIDPDNNHTWKTIRIEAITADNHSKQIWSSEKAIRPISFPLFSDYNWEGLLKRLYKNWNNKWSA